MPLYLIDGYNLLFQITHAIEDLKGQREALLQLLNAVAGERHLKILVVFDARLQTEASKRTHFHKLEVHYTSSNETADDHILHLLTRSQQPYRITVITSDRDLARRSRQQGAKTESIDAFVKILGKRPIKSKGKELPSIPETSVQQPQSKEKAPIPKPSQKTSIEECFDYYYQEFSKQTEED